MKVQGGAKATAVLGLDVWMLSSLVVASQAVVSEYHITNNLCHIEYYGQNSRVLMSRDPYKQQYKGGSGQ